MIHTTLYFTVVIAICLPRGSSAQERPAIEMVAVIASISGDASVTVPADRTRKSLRLFDWLPAGSVVEVGGNSNLIIAFSNGNRYRMESGAKAMLAAGALKAPSGAVRNLPPFPPMPRLAAINRDANAGAKAGAVRIRGVETPQILNLYPRAGTAALPDETTLLFSPVREAARYKVELEDESGRTIFGAETESASLAVPSGILKPGARYYWRVRTVEIAGPAARGETEFTTLASEEIFRRASFKAGLRERGDAESPALTAEIDRRLGLLIEARSELREALAKSPSDQTLRRILAEIELQLYPEAAGAKR